jgi:hypothetical protein
MRSAHGATSGSTDVENEHNRHSRLIQGNPRSLRTIQEPLKVKTRELILRPLTYVRRERSNRAGIITLQLRKCFHVALC